MCLNVRGHTESIELAVTDLGSTDVFLGHDWLKLHNPSIDWEDGSLAFDHCPDSCGYTPILKHVNEDPDKDIELDQTLEPGDRCQTC